MKILQNTKIKKSDDLQNWRVKNEGSSTNIITTCKSRIQGDAKNNLGEITGNMNMDQNKITALIPPDTVSRTQRLSFFHQRDFRVFL